MAKKKMSNEFRSRRRSDKIMRVSNDLASIINFVRANAIMQGRPVPSITRITKVMSKTINKEELLRNVLIQFK